MQISGFSLSNLFVQREALLQNKQASPAATESVSNAQSFSLPNSHDDDRFFTPTAYELKTGFMGSSPATIKAAAASGYGFNPLALLTPSDIDLIQKTTGILIKDGKSYHSDGTLVSIACDSEGNLIDTDVPNVTVAGKLAQSLSDMRFAALTDPSLPYAGNGAITADDIRAYIKMYDNAGVPLQSKAILLRSADVLDATFSAKMQASTA